jgi:hypothetical protein
MKWWRRRIEKNGKGRRKQKRSIAGIGRQRYDCITTRWEIQEGQTECRGRNMDELVEHGCWVDRDLSLCGNFSQLKESMADRWVMESQWM